MFRKAAGDDVAAPCLGRDPASSAKVASRPGRRQQAAAVEEEEEVVRRRPHGGLPRPRGCAATW